MKKNRRSPSCCVVYLSRSLYKFNFEYNIYSCRYTQCVIKLAQTLSAFKCGIKCKWKCFEFSFIWEIQSKWSQSVLVLVCMCVFFFVLVCVCWCVRALEQMSCLMIKGTSDRKVWVNLKRIWLPWCGLSFWNVNLNHFWCKCAKINEETKTDTLMYIYIILYINAY